ncbi:hypothetical protein BC829DRAFT_389997 [Chytridium lagenaria]|nr:hypothetical protein BC829DRAFT_389997 [Chytridium lagenaria]
MDSALATCNDERPSLHPSQSKNVIHSNLLHSTQCGYDGPPPNFNPRRRSSLPEVKRFAPSQDQAVLSRPGLVPATAKAMRSSRHSVFGEFATTIASKLGHKASSSDIPTGKNLTARSVETQADPVSDGLNMLPKPSSMAIDNTSELPKLATEEVIPYAALKRRSSVPGARDMHLVKEIDAHRLERVPASARDFRSSRSSFLSEVAASIASNMTLRKRSSDRMMSPKSSTYMTNSECAINTEQCVKVISTLKEPNATLFTPDYTPDDAIRALKIYGTVRRGSGSKGVEIVRQSLHSDSDPSDRAEEIKRTTTIKMSKPSACPRRFTALPRIDSAGFNDSGDLRKIPSSLGSHVQRHLDDHDTCSNFLKDDDFGEGTLVRLEGSSGKTREVNLDSQMRVNETENRSGRLLLRSCLMGKNSSSLKMNKRRGG